MRPRPQSTLAVCVLYGCAALHPFMPDSLRSPPSAAFHVVAVDTEKLRNPLCFASAPHRAGRRWGGEGTRSAPALHGAANLPIPRFRHPPACCESLVNEALPPPSSAASACDACLSTSASQLSCAFGVGAPTIYMHVKGQTVPTAARELVVLSPSNFVLSRACLARVDCLLG